MDKSDCRLIGTLSKLYGFKGEYVLVADSLLNEEIENWESVFLEIEGLLVPFFIDSLKITSDTSAVIDFEDIDSSDKAKEFVSCNVFQLATVTGNTEEELLPDLLTGYKITDKKAGTVGIIDQILDYNQNLLFRVLKGNTEILIPVSEEIILKINHKKKEVLIQAPEGLLELYL
jgi:16S rRNA processing protein RimM